MVIAISALSLSEEPSSFVNIELYQTFVSHFQQKGLAGFLIHDIGALHDLMNLEWLLAQRAQDILSVIQHDQTPTAARWPSDEPSCPERNTGDQKSPRNAGARRDHPVTEPVSARAGNGNF
jgi:hypothetical protein